MNDLEHRDQQPLRPLSGRRLVATVLGAFALIAVVVVASRGERPAGGSDGGGQTASTVLVNVVLIVLAVVAAAMLVTVLLSLTPGKSPSPKPRTGPKLLGQMVVGAVLLGAVLAAIALLRDQRDGDGEEGAGGRLPTTPLAELENQDDREPPVDIDWLPILLVFGGALLAFTATGVVMLRRGPLPPDEPSLSDRLADVFDETLNDLRAERDPRRAVIAAYARMERVLGRHGMPRQPAEAPHEYVTRVLEELTASGSAVRRLTTLFERAKFSAHEVDSVMKDDAIDALEAVRDELRAREVEPLIAAPH